MKIIGVEFRIGVFRYNGPGEKTAEIFLHPTEIDVPDPLLFDRAGATPFVEATVHSSIGDVTMKHQLLTLPTPDAWYKRPVSFEEWEKMRGDWIDRLRSGVTA